MAQRALAIVSTNRNGGCPALEEAGDLRICRHAVTKSRSVGVAMSLTRA